MGGSEEFWEVGGVFGSSDEFLGGSKEFWEGVGGDFGGGGRRSLGGVEGVLGGRRSVGGVGRVSGGGQRSFGGVGGVLREGHRNGHRN